MLPPEGEHDGALHSRIQEVEQLAQPALARQQLLFGPATFRDHAKHRGRDEKMNEESVSLFERPLVYAFAEPKIMIEATCPLTKERARIF